MLISVLVYNVYQEKKYSFVFIAILFGLVSYLYVPHVLDDKSRYISLYYSFLNSSFSDFVIYVKSGRPDFVFHFLIFLFAKLNISFQVLFLLLTTCTVSGFYFVYSKIINNTYTSRKLFVLSVLLMLLSLSLPDLFSGVRFYFAASIVVLSIYYNYSGKLVFSFLLAGIACLIHFSSLIFLLVLFVMPLIRSKSKLCRYFFFFSLLFLFLSKDSLSSIISFMSYFGESYSNKGAVYLENNDFIESGIEAGGTNTLLVYVASNIWSWFALLYLLFIVRVNTLRNYLYIIFATVNIFYVFPTIFIRYALVVRILFVFLLIYEAQRTSNYRYIYICIGFMGVSVLMNLLVLRNILSVSLMNKDILLTLTLFTKAFTPIDFLND